MDEITPKRKLRRLSFHVLLTIAIVAVGFAQETMEETEIRRGKELRAEGQLDSSIAHFEVARALLRASTQRELYYQCISGIADDLLRKTQFAPADSLLRLAENDARRELGESHRVTAEIYSLLGYLRTYQDRFTEAKDYYSRALEIRERIYKSDDLHIAALYYGLGLVCMRNGEFPLALRDLSKAQAIQQLRPDTAQVDLANTLVALGHVFDMNSQPSKAIEAYSNASALLSKSNLGASPAAAICYHFLAVCFKSLGQSSKSVDYERQALEIYRTVYGENHLATAASLAQLGDHLVLTGDFDRALKCYQESRSIVSGLLGPNHSSMDEVNRKIAGLYATRNDFENALKIDLRVASHHARDFGSENPELGYLYHEIAEIYRKKGDLKKAFKLYSIALKLRREVHSSEARLDIAGLLHDEGRAYISIGEIDSAETLLRLSLSQQDSASLSNPALRSSTYESLAEVCKRRGDFLRSVRWYQQALIALCPEFSDTSILMNPEVPNTICCRDYVRLLAGKATALLGRRGRANPTLLNLKAALRAYALASDALKRLLNSYRSEGSKLILQEEGSSIYSAGMSVAFLIAQRAGEPSAKESAFSFSERGKALILLEALENAKVRHFAGIPDRLLDDEKRLQKDLTSLLNKSEWIQRRADSASSSALRRAILDKNWKIDQLEDSLANFNPQFNNLSYRSRLTSSSEVQSVLDSGTCLVEYSIGRTSLYSLVVRKHSFDLVKLDRPRNLDSLAKSLRHALRTMNDPSYLSAARELYSDLVQPIEKYLSGARRLVIIPDGDLYYLPFEVLLSADIHRASKDHGRIDFRHLPYLLNRFEICYALSGTLFCEAQSSTEINHGGSMSFAGFAPVSRALYESVTVAAKIRFGKVGYGGLKSMSFAGSRFGALPYSEDEVRSVATAFNASGRIGTYVVGSRATKGEFKAHAPGHSIIHIATHGIIDEDHPGLSALLFAPSSDSTTGEDALLYSGEIYNLRLNADLVTLSSCESGVGKLVRGEGLMAMTRGFFYAGAKNVVCSLWKVYDNQADQLMRRFYRHVLEGRGFSSALREAKLELIKNEATAHPFKWAGFELIGE